MNLPDDLVKVCLDAGESIWQYSPSKQSYFRIYPDHGFTFIEGKYLPDPEVLLMQKAKSMSSLGKVVNLDKLKSSQAVYKLYEHWKQVATA